MVISGYHLHKSHSIISPTNGYGLLISCNQEHKIASIILVEDMFSK